MLQFVRNKALNRLVSFVIAFTFVFTNSAGAALVASSHTRAKPAAASFDVEKTIGGELSAQKAKKADDGGEVLPYIVERVGKGLQDYGVHIQRIAINNGTAHGNNYDKDGNLIQTKMNLGMTAAIANALKQFGVAIVQHGITGTPLENIKALRDVGIRSGHVGTNWQNIIFETLVAEQKNNAEAKAMVFKLIADTAAKTGKDTEAKYKVNWDAIKADLQANGYVPGKDKNLDKLIGKELKNALGMNYDGLVGLSQELKDKITEATYISAKEHMLKFGADGTATIVRDYCAANNIPLTDFASLPGKYVFDALANTDRTLMCCNIRNPLSYEGIAKAAKELGAVVIFQQAMSELGYTWPNDKDITGNVKLFADNTVEACKKQDFKDFLMKADHITVKVDKVFLADIKAQAVIEQKFEEILAESDTAKREQMYNAFKADPTFGMWGSDSSVDVAGSQTAKDIANAMKAIDKALNLVKSEVANGYTVYALDASFMPMPLNVRISAFLAGFIPVETAGLEAEVGEIGGDDNSTVADALEFITGVRYKERVYTDRQGSKVSELFQNTPVKRIGILTGGGPASGHNPLIRAAVETAKKEFGGNVEIIAIFDGWKGLVSDASVAKARTLTLAEMDSVANQGGTILGTSREAPYSEKDVAKGSPAKVWANIQKLQLDALITCGGDDTNSTSDLLSKDHPEFRIVGVPKTMDNDMNGIDRTYGYITFTDAAGEVVDWGKVDAASTGRVLVAEVFGRSAGFAPMRIGAMVGAARTLIPEEKDLDLEKMIKDVSAYFAKNGHAIVIVSEGVSINENFGNNKAILQKAFDATPGLEAQFRAIKKLDNYKNPKLENAGALIGAILEANGLSGKLSKAGKLDYFFRSADVAPADKEMCELIGGAAVRSIMNGRSSRIIYADNNEIKSRDFTDKLGGRKMDITGADKEEYLQGNLAILTGDEDIIINQDNAGIFNKVLASLYKTSQGEKIDLTFKQLQSVLWKLGNISVNTPEGDRTETFQSVRRVVNALSKNQQEQLKRMAQRKSFKALNAGEKLALALKPVNILVTAGNALIFRAGAFNLYVENYEPGVNVAAIKSLKGSKEASADEFVRMNSRYNGSFGPYKVEGMRYMKDAQEVINGVTVDYIFVPGDKNINRPDMKIMYFGSEVTTAQMIDVFKAKGVDIDVVAEYGPGKEAGGAKQPGRLQEYLEAGWHIAAASPINTDGLKDMLKARLEKEGLSGEKLEKAVKQALKEALYSTGRKDIGPDTLIADTLTCTSNAMLSVIKAVYDAFGIDHGNGITVHSQTDSNEMFPMKSGRARDPLDIGRGDSVDNNIIPASTGAAKNLFKIIPALKGKDEDGKDNPIKDKFTISAVRTGTISGSFWSVTIDLKKAVKDVAELRAVLKDFAENKSDGVVKFYEGDPEVNNGALDTNAIVGWNNISIIDNMLLKVFNGGMTVTIQGYYDNQSAAPNQIVSKWAPWMVDGVRAQKVARMPVTAVASDGGAFVPLLGKVINNMSRFTGLPFVMPKGNFDESTPYKYWSEALKVLHFSQPMFRRVENDDTELMRGNKEFVYGQNNRPAYPDVIKDEEIIRLTADAYDITEFPGGVRKVTDMEAVLRDGAAIDGNNAYYMHRGPFASREDIEKSFYGPNLLRYDITVLPPQMWGDEPVKTYGHFHNPVEKPEMYQVLAGECVWIQQKEEKQADGSSKVVDFVATRATAGDIVVMMPGYGHISVNISDTEPLVMANWLTWNQKSYYGSFGEKKGAAFHLIKDAEGKLAFVANPLYPESATLEIKQMAPKENRKFGIYQGSAIYRLVQQPKAVFDRLTDFLYHPEKYDGELTPEKMLSDQVAPGDIIPVKQPVTADDFSKEMYSALSSKNGSFVKAVKGLDEKGIKGAVVVDAKTIFRNAGTVEALQKIREAGEAMQVVVWTNNMGDFNDLRKLKVDEKLNIKIQVKALATVITELENEGINPARITIIDSGNIRQVQEIAKMAEGVNVTYLQAPNAQKGRLNFMPLIVNRAVALAAKDDDVNKAFGTTAKISGKLVASEGSMLDAYQKQHKLSEADLAALDLYTGSNIVPLTKTTETLAAIQTGYEKTVNQI